MKIICPKCGKKSKFWQLKDGRIKCSNCVHKLTARKHQIRISFKVLRQIVSEFILEHSANTILDRVKVSKYKLLKILTLLRVVMTKDVPEVFSGIVEVDEAYLGGQWKNKRLSIKKKHKQSKKGRGTTKQPFLEFFVETGKHGRS